MTLGGWIMLVCSWGAIVGLASFCFSIMIKHGKM